jgi:hypothetical protein
LRSHGAKVATARRLPLNEPHRGWRSRTIGYATPSAHGRTVRAQQTAAHARSGGAGRETGAPTRSRTVSARTVDAAPGRRMERPRGMHIRARRRRDVGPGGRWHRDVRTIRWSRVVRTWSGRLLRCRWRRGLLHGPVPPTSARPADHRPGCPAAGSPAWCPGWGSAPAPGCPGPPRPADGSPRPVCRYQGASRGRLRVAKCRARGGPAELVPREVDRAAPDAAPVRTARGQAARGQAARGQAARTPLRSPRGHRPSAGRRRPPSAGHCANGRAAQASLRDTP